MKERILQYLIEHGSITSWEAIKEFGCTRLSQYIYLLKNEGYTIESETVTTRNRYNEPSHFKKYILVVQNV